MREYFCSCAGIYLDRMQSNAVKVCLLKAYRLDHIVSGARIERFSARWRARFQRSRWSVSTQRSRQ